MEALCDELIQEIFHRVPPPHAAAVSLVSRRWLRLLRSSTTSLSLHFPPPYTPSSITSLSTFLNQHPFLSSLSLAVVGDDGDGENPLLAAAASCPNLRHIRFVGSPVSLLSLRTLSSYCIHLSSIEIAISRPLSFDWLINFNQLKNLSIYFTNSPPENQNPEVKEVDFDVELGLESLSLTGIRPGDFGLGPLWRNCKKVKKLHLKSCESVGDYSSFSSFLNSLTNLQELELKACRTIADLVLLKLAQTSVSLKSLLIYDGVTKEGLLQFITQSKCRLTNLDLRLPLDLDNTHLIALSKNPNFGGLLSLRLQSCCLVSGEGLRAVGRALANGLVELALVNCDVVEREPGLLTDLGQNLKGLRKLDLSYNEMLGDKEVVSMLASCGLLVELRLRGCNRLTNAGVGPIVRSCKKLRSVDVAYCRWIGVEGVECFVTNLPWLRRIEVEEGKVSDVAKMRASNKMIEIVC